MAIAETNLIWRLSGGATNTSAAASLGGVMSAEGAAIITKTKTFNSIFDDISGAEAAAGDIEYRCIYITNTSATTGGLTSPKVWIETNVANANDMIDIGLDLAGVDADADTVATESDAPSPAVTFAHDCLSYATGLALSAALTASGGRAGIWIRRTITTGMTADDDEFFTLKVQGDTAA
jgi:hypothetical protein